MGGRPGIHESELPLRILVQSDIVGAIIGRSGSTIRQITHDSRARIDVHRDENQEQHGKVITINGTPESCSAACYRILEVIRNEKMANYNNNNNNNTSTTANNNNNNSSSSSNNNNNNNTSSATTNPINANSNNINNDSGGLTNTYSGNNEIHDGSIDTVNSTRQYSTQELQQPHHHQHHQQQQQPDFDVQLRILAHNNLIGRLIGKSGSSIKKIMDQTSTKINVSINGLTDCTSEHTITVTGNMEQVRQAEHAISAKLRSAYLSDVSTTLQAINQQPYLFSNTPFSCLPAGHYNQNHAILSGGQVNSSGHGMARSAGMPVGPHHHPHQHIPGAAPSLYQGSAQSYLPLYPGLNAAAVPPTGHGFMGSFNPPVAPSAGPVNPVGLDQERQTVQIYIPNNMVGALIGKSGSAIKEMISNSGANIKVAPAPTSTVPQHAATASATASSSSKVASSVNSAVASSVSVSQATEVTEPTVNVSDPASSGEVSTGESPEKSSKSSSDDSAAPSLTTDADVNSAGLAGSLEQAHTSAKSDSRNGSNCSADDRQTSEITAVASKESSPEKETLAGQSRSPSDHLQESSDSHQQSQLTATTTASANLGNNNYQSQQQQQPAMRRVTIIGTPESQCSAQYLIYRKVAAENGKNEVTMSKNDVSLMVEIRIPAELVGRIIGKGGQTIRKLQSQTRTIIRLSEEKPMEQYNSTISNNPENVNSDAASTATESIPEDRQRRQQQAPQAFVRITGTFQSSQLAQRHIRNLILDGQYSRPKSHSNKIANNTTNNFNSSSANNSSYYNAKNENINNNNNIDGPPPNKLNSYPNKSTESHQQRQQQRQLPQSLQVEQESETI